MTRHDAEFWVRVWVAICVLLLLVFIYGLAPEAFSY